jgi:hypothetical protein
MSSIIEQNLNLVNTKLKEDRLLYGLSNELHFHQLINPLFIKTDMFNFLDYKMIIKDTSIFIELKTRKNTINTFKTTIIPKHKIDYFNQLKGINYLYLCFGFIDDHNNHKINYYYIKYNKLEFQKLKIISIFQKDHYQIPIHLLISFETFNEEIDELIFKN